MLETLAVSGADYLVVVVGAALFLRDPPDGYRPAGWEPAADGEGGGQRVFDLRGALGTSQ